MITVPRWVLLAVVACPPLVVFVPPGPQAGWLLLLVALAVHDRITTSQLTGDRT